MDIMALDRNFIPTGSVRLPYLDLSWHRKYYETGQFSVQIQAEAYNDEMCYIFSPERPELGIIQKVVFTGTDGIVMLEGYFYEKRLADKMIYPAFEKSATRVDYVAAAVEKYKADIPKLEIASYISEGEVVQKQEVGTSLEEMANNVLMVEEKSFRCVYNYERDVVYFEIWQGQDRTQSQTKNNFVTFSEGFRNICNVKTQIDDSGYKNYFVVQGGVDDNENQIEAVLDMSGGGYRRELFIDASGKKYNSKKQTLAEYKEILIQKAVEKAEKYVSIHNVEFDAVADAGAKYLTDYDLGDKCDIIIETIKQSYEARIIEVLETWSRGVHEVTLTFGDKIPTIYERARIR